MQRAYYANSGSTEKFENSNHISLIVRQIMEMHREAEDELGSIRECPDPCSDRTVEVVTKTGNYTRRPCPIANLECAYGRLALIRLEEYLRNVMHGIGVPQRHLNNFVNVRDTVAVIKASEWNTAGFLLLCGSSESGKSFGAAWAVREYLRRKIPDVLDWVTWNQIESVSSFITWRRAMEISLDKEILSGAVNSSLSIIDDLGSEDGARNGISAVRHLISMRFESEKPTVITTKLTIKEISNRYGKAIAVMITKDARRGGKVIYCGNKFTEQDEKSVLTN